MVSQSFLFTSDPAGDGSHLVEMIHQLVPGSHALSDDEVLSDFLAVEFVPNHQPIPMEAYDHV